MTPAETYTSIDDDKSMCSIEVRRVEVPSGLLARRRDLGLPVPRIIWVMEFCSLVDAEDPLLREMLEDARRVLREASNKKCYTERAFVKAFENPVVSYEEIPYVAELRRQHEDIREAVEKRIRGRIYGNDLRETYRDLAELHREYARWYRLTAGIRIGPEFWLSKANESEEKAVEYERWADQVQVAT